MMLLLTLQANSIFGMEEEEGEVVRPGTPRQIQTFTQWAEACNRRLGRYRFKVVGGKPEYNGNYETPLSKEDFEETIKQFIDTAKGSSFNKPENWLITKKFTKKIERIRRRKPRVEVEHVNKVILASEQSNQREEKTTRTTKTGTTITTTISPDPTEPNRTIPDPSLFDENSTRTEIGLSTRRNLFVQRLVVDNNNEIVIISDLHGDAHSPIEYLKDLKSKNYFDDNFKITKNAYIVFTGDYSDRGPNGAEALYTAMKLKIANPERVIMLRGNHEAFDLNKNSGSYASSGMVGFTKELRRKFGYSLDTFKKKIITVYDLLPSALYIGTPVETPDGQNIIKYALICHGGPEIRFDPRPLLSYPQKRVLYQKIDFLNAINSKECWLKGKGDFHRELEKIARRFKTRHEEKWFIEVPRQINFPERKTNSFAWVDFIVGPEGETEYFKGSGIRGANFGKPLITGLLEACRDDYTYRLKRKVTHELGTHYRLETIIRGHQHAGKMGKKMREHNGIYNSWTPTQWNGTPGTELSLANSPAWTMYVSPESIYGRVYGRKYFSEGLIHDYNCGIYAILKLINWKLAPVKVEVFPKS